MMESSRLVDVSAGGLYQLGRQIWGERYQMTLSEILIALGVVYGDLCRQARDGDRRADLEREFGNLILSSIRWAGDLGLDLDSCLSRAVDAQMEFAKRVHGGVNIATHGLSPEKNPPAGE